MADLKTLISAAEAGIKKRRQHYVWQHYLKSWTTDGHLHCLMAGRIFPTGTTNIAVEKDFYKIGKLIPADIALIRMLVIDVDGLHPLTRTSHEKFLSLVCAPMLLQGILKEADKLIELLNTNMLEDYHAGIETAFLPLLESALKGDISFYSDGNSCISLAHFLATQHMRTKGVREKSIGILNQKDRLDASRIWGILSLMFAENIGMSVFMERRKRKLILIENRTGREFITGDQPIINLHSDGKVPPPTLCWYYPISPGLALHLTEVDRESEVTTHSLTESDVDLLNARMVAASHSQAFARLPASLEPYVGRNSAL